MPSQLKRLHDWKTRVDPLEEDWPWVVSQLERDLVLQGSTLFVLMCERHPSRYRPAQVRTLQRHIQQWRVVHGPDREVMFAQQHFAGERGQSDFTHMEDVSVTIAGIAFPHLVYHFVLTYSNIEAVSLCFSESFEALAEGIEKADRQYVRLLHLAARTSESEVETALLLLLETRTAPTFDAVRDLVHIPHARQVPAFATPDLDLSPYDKLIPSRRTHAYHQ